MTGEDVEEEAGVNVEANHHLPEMIDGKNHHHNSHLRGIMEGKVVEAVGKITTIQRLTGQFLLLVMNDLKLSYLEQEIQASISTNMKIFLWRQQEMMYHLILPRYNNSSDLFKLKKKVQIPSLNQFCMFLSSLRKSR